VHAHDTLVHALDSVMHAHKCKQHGKSSHQLPAVPGVPLPLPYSDTIRLSWAAQSNTWLLNNLMPKGVLFSFLSIRLYQVSIGLYAGSAGAVKPVSGDQ